MVKAGSPELPFGRCPTKALVIYKSGRGARGASAMGIVLLRNLRLVDAVRSALDRRHGESCTLNPWSWIQSTEPQKAKARR